MMNYTIEKYTEHLTKIYITEKNGKDESLMIELSECTNPGGKNSLPYLWHKAGYTDKILDTYLCIHTYCTDSEGGCFGRYNPQEKRSDDGKRNVINFDWMFENTEENKQKLINEVIRLFESATGKSATEIKLEKIHQFANKRGLNVYTEIPEGWKENFAMTFPSGCTRIVNGERFFKHDSAGKLTVNSNYKEAVYVY